MDSRLEFNISGLQTLQVGFKTVLDPKKIMIRLNKILKIILIFRDKQYLKIVNEIQHVGIIIIALASIMHVREYDFPNI